MKQFLTELLLGDQSEEKEFRLSRLHAHEGGMISMSSLFVTLAFFVLIGFLGNAGQAVYRKIEVQNAADSMAHSTTVWMARHMNAITVTNHLMGELTAVVVLVEGLGGPELDGKKEKAPKNEDDSGGESVFWNNAINLPLSGSISFLPGEFKSAIKKFSKDTEFKLVPIKGSIGQSISGFDSQYADFIRKLVTNDNAEHDACATIYDGRMSIKVLVWYAFMTKLSGNGMYAAATAISLGSAEPIAAAANLAVHLLIDAALLPVIKDWYLINIVEVFASGLRPLREPVLPLVIQGISLYADSVVMPTQLQNVIRQSLDRSKQEFSVIEYETFPLLRDLNLPVMKEKPSEKSTKTSIVPSLADKKPKKKPEVQFITGPINAIVDAIETINDLIKAVTFGIADDLLDSLDIRKNLRDNKPIAIKDGGGNGFVKNPSFKYLGDDAKKSGLDWHEERHSQWVRATYPHVDKLRTPMCDFFERYIPCSYMSTYYVHWTNRYTISVSHRLRSTLLGGSQQNSQQLQASLKTLRKKLDALRNRFQTFLEGVDEDLAESYDALNELRKLSGELSDIKSELMSSGVMKDIGTKIPLDAWLKLVDSHIQDAENDGKNADYTEDLDVDKADFELMVQTIAWINYLGYLLDALDNILSQLEALLDFGPPHMYVMKQSTPEAKGNEVWTSDSAAAEKLFTVQMFVKRLTPAAILTPPLYPNPNKDGIVAVAESMLYNGNGRDIQKKSDQKIQPNTGWDLLNWEPPVKAPEWGRSDVSGNADSGKTLDVFTKGLTVGDSNRIQVNWQSKLVPIGPMRLRTAMEAPTVKKLFQDQGNQSMLPTPEFVLH